MIQILVSTVLVFIAFLLYNSGRKEAIDSISKDSELAKLNKKVEVLDERDKIQDQFNDLINAAPGSWSGVHEKSTNQLH